MSAPDEDDDFYGSEPSKPGTPTIPASQINGSSVKDAKTKFSNSAGISQGADEQYEEDYQDEKDEEDEEDEDGDEEEESDSDIEIITERPQGQPPTITTPLDIKPPAKVPVTISAPASAQPQSHSPAPISSAVTTKIEPPTKINPSKFGSNLPEVRTSTLDVNRVPEWEPVGKPITEIDIDADLAEQAKAWRMPGADQSDYFNYGFDEFTWTTYCLRQQSMASALQDQKAEAQKFEMMLGGAGLMGPGPHGHNHPGQVGPGGMMMGPGSGPGMMGGMDEQMMHQMMSNMLAQGIDPNDLSFDTFMQQMQQMQGGMPGGIPGGMGGAIPGGMPPNMGGNMSGGISGPGMQGVPGPGPGGIINPGGMPPQGPSGGPPNMMQQGNTNQWGGNQKMRRW